MLDASTGADVILVDVDAQPRSRSGGLSRLPRHPGRRTLDARHVDRTVRIAYFRDTGLAPSTRYYYYVTAVDSSGNESAPSPVASINTNPHQLTGWPIELASSSSCPPAVGDITGDGTKEIVAGNEHLYAWNANGIEVRDDDNDPQTWGVFATEVKTITGAVALGEMDRSIAWLRSLRDLMGRLPTRPSSFRGDGSIHAGLAAESRSGERTKGLLGRMSPRSTWTATGASSCSAPPRTATCTPGIANGTPLGGESPPSRPGSEPTARIAASFANLDGDPYARDRLRRAERRAVHLEHRRHQLR